MWTIEQYLDAAKRARGLPTDVALARALGRSPGNVTHWRTRRCWPDDTVMLRLAEMAGRDPLEALVDLNSWRAKAPEVKALYARIADAVRAGAISAAMALMMMALPGAPSPAMAAANNPAQTDPISPPGIHYATNGSAGAE